MPTVQVSEESMRLLLTEAKELGCKIKDVADKCIVESLLEIEDESEEEDEDEEDEEEEE